MKEKEFDESVKAAFKKSAVAFLNHFNEKDNFENAVIYNHPNSDQHDFPTIVVGTWDHSMEESELTNAEAPIFYFLKHEYKKEKC